MDYNFPINEWYLELDLLKRHPDLWQNLPLYSRTVEGDAELLKLCRRRFNAEIELPGLALRYLQDQGVPAKIFFVTGDPEVEILVPAKPLIETIPQIKPIVTDDTRAIMNLLIQQDTQAIDAARKRFEAGWNR